MHDLHKTQRFALFALSAVIFAAPFTASALEINRYLVTGTRGSDVSSLQQFLIDGSHLRITAPTGYFGPLTTSAVASWQKDQGITPTGTVGPITRARLGSQHSASASAAAGGSSAAAPVVIVPSGFVSLLSQIVGSSTASTTDATTTDATVAASGNDGGGSVVTFSETTRRRSSHHTADATITYATVASTTPADGSTGAPRNHGIQIRFGGAMNASTINSTNITVTSNGTPITGTVSYSDAVGPIATFLPDSTLGANAHIAVTVSNNVLNTAGIGLLDDAIIEFDTTSTLDAQSAINLSDASSYGILATGLTNVNPTTIFGDLGTGADGQLANPTVNGTNHYNDSSYTSAQTALSGALSDANTRVCDTTESGSVDLGGRTFAPGVYCFGGPNTITGTTTLSTAGTYIFKFGGTLTLSASSTVSVVNGANPSTVYWIVDSSSVIGSGARLLGNLLAKATTTVNTNANIDGRLLSQSNVTTTGTTTTTVPGTVYCSTIGPYTATSQAPAGSFKVAYIATNGSTLNGTTIDATGCDVGLYVGHNSTVTATNLTIHDAGKSGVFNDAGSLALSSSTISKIGDHLGTTWHFGGTQTGLAVQYMDASSGSVIGNTIFNYQKAGIVIRNLNGVLVRNNTITGEGSTTVNAQIGLQLGFPLTTVSSTTVSNVTGNTITQNIDTLVEAAAGILGSMVSGESTTTLTSTLDSTNTVHTNGSAPGDDIVVQ